MDKAAFIKELNECLDDCGEKGKNLKILSNLFSGNTEIFVPDTLVLPIKTFQFVVKDNKETQFKNYNDIYIDPELEKIILDTIHKKFGFQKLVIRSSATCEDSIFFSGSGQYDSFLNIESDSKIIEAIKKVYVSFFAENSNLYSKIYGIDMKREGMAVLIQPVASVINAGVAFSCDPVTHENKSIVESTNGLGTAVVEGTGEIEELMIDYNGEDWIDDKIKLLTKTINTIRQHFGFEVDVEWGFDKVGDLYLFQVRPIIFSNIKFESRKLKAKSFQKCISFSKGFSIGRINDIEKSDGREILYQNTKYKYDNFGMLLSSRGMITEKKSKLSHISNILRELAKPCVYINNLHYNINHLYIIDAFNDMIIDYQDLSNPDKIEAFFEYFCYLKESLKISYEKYNGILDIKNDDKIEEVVFGLDTEEVKSILQKNEFKINRVRQKIFTYDFNDDFLIRHNTIFRIQEVGDKVNMQFKLLDTSNKQYRKERGIRILFHDVNAAKKFAESFNLVETGYQEREIVKIAKGHISVNIIEWPGCDPYLGIEGQSISDLDKINQLLKIKKDMVSGMGGKEIFEKLGLSIKKCEFDKEKAK